MIQYKFIRDRVVLVKSRTGKTHWQFTDPQWMPPNVEYLGVFCTGINKYKMFGYGEASPKWKKYKCS